MGKDKLMNYIKFEDGKMLLTDDGIQQNGTELIVVITNDSYEFETVKDTLLLLSDITIYGCVDEDTDEYVANYYENYKLSSLEYNIDDDTYTATFIRIDDTEKRLDEIESTLNEILMGGAE